MPIISTGNTGAQGPARRTVLASLLAASAGSSIPRALAGPATDAAGNAFLTVSTILTGRAALDPMQSERLFEALSAHDRQFSEKAQALLALIERQRIDPLHLQHVLERGALGACAAAEEDRYWRGISASSAKARTRAASRSKPA